MAETSQLFRQYALRQIKGRVLVTHLDDAALLAELPANPTEIFHKDWAILRGLEKRLSRHAHIQFSDAVFPTGTPLYDTALAVIPKGRDYARAVIADALTHLEVGGYLFAVGGNDSGAKAFYNDMRELAQVALLGHKARQRIFAIRRPAALSIPAEWGDLWTPRPLTLQIREQDYTVYTQPGVFSWEHLDSGTAFLLQHLPGLNIAPGSRILDAACGYGIIGMVAARELAAREAAPSLVVWADTDLLALRCAEMALPGEKIIRADLTHNNLPGHAPFDVILCNPPFHKEHETETTFMRGFAANAAAMLVKGGRLVLVANIFLPYIPLLEGHFSHVKRLAENGQYQIIQAVL